MREAGGVPPGSTRQLLRPSAELARLTKERDLPLGEEHAISQQIVDEAVQAHNARVADVAAANNTPAWNTFVSM